MKSDLFCHEFITHKYSYSFNHTEIFFAQVEQNILQLEIRSVERGICPIATSTINERTVTIIMAGCMAHEREGYISTSSLKSDVTLVFLDPDFLQDAQISAIWP